MSEALGIEKGKVIEALRKDGIRAEMFMREEGKERTFDASSIGCLRLIKMIHGLLYII